MAFSMLAYILMLSLVLGSVCCMVGICGNPLWRSMMSDIQGSRDDDNATPRTWRRGGRRTVERES